MDTNFRRLLDEVLTKEGILSKCYTLLYSYSLANSVLLASQQEERGQEIAPCASFAKWQSLGGKIKKGSKALYVFIPKMKTYILKDENGEETPVKLPYGFFLKNAVFSLNDIDGIERAKLPEVKNGFNLSKVMKELNIKQVNFESVNGNSQGYCCTDTKEIAINPIACNAFKTAIHEIAHAVLHTTKKGKEIKRSTKEVEAETTAYIILNTLGITNYNKEMRGYIQNWASGNEIKETTAQRIFGAASKILKLGLAE